MRIGGTTLEQFLGLVEQAGEAGKNMVPIALEVLEDMMTPALAFLTLQRDGVPSFLYESVIGGERTARYSFLGFNPFQTLTFRDGRIKIVGRDGQMILDTTKYDLRQMLEIEMARYSMLSVPGLPSFSGGMVGNFGYDAIRLIEPQIKDKNHDELGLPDISLMFFDVIIAFDHVTKRIYLIKLVNVKDDDLDQSYRQAIGHLEELHQQLLRPKFSDLVPGTSENGVKSNLSKKQFEDMVRRCKEHIVAGDIFQVVISQRFSCDLTVDPFTIYRCLREKNPAPYLFFLDFGEWQLIGSSPEIMVNIIDRQVTIHPLAGTRKRGKNDAEDEALAKDLLGDPKEEAEHEMLVDLARSDAARVSKPGTVKVTKHRLIVMYSTVMHIASEVIGILKDGLSPLEALWACLPAGTLSGAPKIRAMEIIEELEPTRRGPYGGCVGFLGFDGNIVTAIVIRTAVVAKGKVSWQAGAGIVYDSDPTSEWEETCRKAASILRALIMAGTAGKEKVS